MSDWSVLKAGGPPKLAAWPGMGPPIDQGDASEFAMKPRRRYALWFGMVSAIIIAGGMLAALNVERVKGIELARRMNSDANRVRKAAPPVVAKPILSPTAGAEANALTRPATAVVKDFATTGTRLVNELFAAQTMEARMACLFEGSRHRGTLREFFSGLKSPIKLQSFRPLGSSVRAMPGAESMTLCEVTTDYSSRGTAITRLIVDTDGTTKLDWPMLHDSLKGVLASYSAKPSQLPQWVTLGMKRNFGFDQPEPIRSGFLVFDLQGMGNGVDRTIGVVSKSSPTGRALESALGWSELYIVRTLLHWETIGDQPRLTILDAELVPAGEGAQ